MGRQQLRGQTLKRRQQVEQDDQRRVVVGQPTAAEESEQLMTGHTREISAGATSVQPFKNVLLMDVNGIKFHVPRGVGEELLAQLTRALRPYAGYSIFDRIMQENDAVIDRLMAGESAEDGQDKGRAEALTKCLAMIRNPYEPDYPEEKRRQMERWRKRNEASEE